MKQFAQLNFTEDELEMLMTAVNRLSVYYGEKMEDSITGYWADKWMDAGSLWKMLYEAREKMNA